MFYVSVLLSGLLLCRSFFIIHWTDSLYLPVRRENLAPTFQVFYIAIYYMKNDSTFIVDAISLKQDESRNLNWYFQKIFFSYDILEESLRIRGCLLYLLKWCRVFLVILMLKTKTLFCILYHMGIQMTLSHSLVPFSLRSIQ